MSNTRFIQYTHRPNATELGMGNTHETYMLISTDTDLSSIFPPSTEIKVKDVYSGKRYTLKSADGREFRVNQMGELYRDYNVRPGDEIIISKIEKAEVSEVCVKVRQFQRVVLMVGSNGTEIINIDRLGDYKVDEQIFNISISDRGYSNILSISFRESRKKRQDSPNMTDYYDVNINGEKLANGTYYLSLGKSFSSLAMLPKSEFNEVSFDDEILNNLKHNQSSFNSTFISPKYRPFITAIKSKPFLLLAGISGTGKSRIVRELARSCWEPDSEEYNSQKPSNFEMVQVKPNWHDSSELIGYVSRIDGECFIAGDFLKFIAKAWENPNVPFFLCLDEMNLAPVEQYFAEYLSVIESRKANKNGVVTTDPILKKDRGDWYRILTSELTDDDSLRTQFLEEGITIPQNLIVVGTVNMDETTFSFSRKVLDRAMTIEMNKVDLMGGLESKFEPIGKLSTQDLIGTAVEGIDVYEGNRANCDTVISYLKAINDRLEGTPFKVAYRTRNEFLLYVVNNLPYNKDDEGKEIGSELVIARALDEITSMKVLSRIEGDESKVTKGFLEGLEQTIKEQLKAVATEYNFIAEAVQEENKKDEEGKTNIQSISLAKLAEMKKRLVNSGYTSFWA